MKKIFFCFIFIIFIWFTHTINVNCYNNLSQNTINKLDLVLEELNDKISTQTIWKQIIYYKELYLEIQNLKLKYKYGKPYYILDYLIIKIDEEIHLLSKEFINNSISNINSNHNDDNDEFSPFWILGLEPNTDDINYAKELNVKWTRAHGLNGLNWDMVETNSPLGNPDNYNWSKTDKLINYFIDNNIKVLWTVNPYNAIDQGDSDISNRSSTKLPNNLDAYSLFLQSAVERYDWDGIDDADGSPIVIYWQIHNEINVSDFFWDDTPENYALLLKTSYDAIKSANSEAKVVIWWLSNPAGLYEGKNNYNSILQELKKIDGDFDVFDVHWFGFTWDYKEHNKAKETLNHFINTSLKDALKDFSEKEIWITENGTHSGIDVVGNKIFKNQTEKEQAIELFKRYIYPLAYGVDKIFWRGIVESASYSQEFKHNDYFDNIGLVYNGCSYEDNFTCKCDENTCESDLGENTKKLSFYTYKLMTEKLQKSDWDNIETIQETDDIYIYKFINKETNKNIWVAWNENISEQTISLNLFGIENAKITKVVPNYKNGLEVKESNDTFENIFDISYSDNSFLLSDIPVFIEEY